MDNWSGSALFLQDFLLALAARSLDGQALSLTEVDHEELYPLPATDACSSFPRRSASAPKVLCSGPEASWMVPYCIFVPKGSFLQSEHTFSAMGKNTPFLPWHHNAVVHPKPAGDIVLAKQFRCQSRGGTQQPVVELPRFGRLAAIGSLFRIQNEWFLDFKKGIPLRLPHIRYV